MCIQCGGPREGEPLCACSVGDLGQVNPRVHAVWGAEGR